MSAISAGSVIVPAWNEADVIAATISALFEGDDCDADDPTVVVACNGCTDETVQIVRDLDVKVTVLDLPPVGKARAIREAELVARQFPRIYLDADVVLDRTALDALWAAFEAGAIAARPPVQFVTDGASWPVKAYYRVRQQLPEVADDLCGAGVYGLSESARSRFGEFPDVQADDLFVARVVDRSEVVVVDTAPVRVQAPRTVASLTRTLSRVYRGNREVAGRFPDLMPNTTRSTVVGLRRLARSPRRWLDVATFAGVVVVGRLRSRRTGREWSRDQTGRDAAKRDGTSGSDDAGSR